MAVFMFEAQRVVTGQVLVNEAMRLRRTDPARTDLIQADLVRTEDDLLELAVWEHARLVYRVAYSVLRDHHDAEDATQETFLRVLRYRRKLAGVRDARTWLARIAWRVAVERRRKTSQISLDDDDAEKVVTQLRSKAAGADEMLLSAEMSGFLGSLIAALPVKLRDPLTLSTVEEMSPADVAEVLGIKEAAVRSRLFRARQILRERLMALLDGKHGS
jgi:RNA polymerase sigma-70 factor, ECF subfamily